MEWEGDDAEGGEEEERGAGQQRVEPVLVAGVREPGKGLTLFMYKLLGCLVLEDSNVLLKV